MLGETERMKRKSFVVGGITAAAVPFAADAAAAVEIPDCERAEFTDGGGKAWTYYRTAANGPPVMVLHEIFGLTPADADFGRRLAKRGFTVYMPVLFGVPYNDPGLLTRAGRALRVCVSGEFAAFSKRRSSPVAHSMRTLGELMFARHGGRGIGVVGLCLTGDFALAMMADPHLVAPVLSEPSLPLGVTVAAHRSLHLGTTELACVKQRAAEGVTYLGFRFDGDWISPVERFDELQRQLGPAFERHDLTPTVRGSHSVFAVDYDANATVTYPAFERLVAYLKEQLNSAG